MNTFARIAALSSGCIASNNRGLGISTQLASITNCSASLNGLTGIVNFGSVTHCTAYSNGDHGISSNGVIAFCLASNNNRNNNGSVDISSSSGTRTGNNPAP